MTKIGYDNTMNSQGGGTPLFSTNPDKKKKKDRTIHLDNVDVYGKKPTGSINMEYGSLQKEKGSEKKSKQEIKTEKRLKKNEEKKKRLEEKFANKKEKKIERQKRLNSNKEVRDLKHKLRGENKIAKWGTKNKRK